MSFCNSRKTVIRNLNDGHIVARLTIDYEVNQQSLDEAVCVDLKLSGEKGNHETHFCMRKDVYYNLPQKINHWLKQHELVGTDYSLPLCPKSSIHSGMCLDMLSEIHSELGPEEKVDLERFLADHY